MKSGCVESLIGRLRDEWLNEILFHSLRAARVTLDQWRNDYNAVRPLTSLEGFAPHAFSNRLQNNHNPNGLRL